MIPGKFMHQIVEFLFFSAQFYFPVYMNKRMRTNFIFQIFPKFFIHFLSTKWNIFLPTFFRISPNAAKESLKRLQRPSSIT